MSPSRMLDIPTKTTDETDWSKPLKHYIEFVYGSGEDFSEECSLLNKLRQDIRGAGKDLKGKDILYRYYGQLELLDLRIPVEENGCKISFTWYDCLLVDIPTTQHSLAFEKASVLFNLAAIHSSIATNSYSSDLKLSYNYFQSASGIFYYIAENFLHAPSLDLNKNTVKTLSTLMLAQAQEVFIERLLVDNNNSKLAMISKLAQAASNLYNNVVDGLEESLVNGWGEKSWLVYAKVKYFYNLSVANYYQSKHLSKNNSSETFGSSIAYCELALQHVQSALKQPLEPNFNNLIDLLNAHLQLVQQYLETVQKDNDFIFHANIPPTASLPNITELEAAKRIPLNNLYKGEDISKIIGRDIFEKIIPLSVHEQASKYSEKKANLLRTEGEKVELADEELISALEFLSLPSAITVIKNSLNDSVINQDVPSEINEYASKISSNKIINIDSLETIRKQILLNLDESTALLKKEEMSYNTYKQTFNSSWTQSDSSIANMNLYSEIRGSKESLFRSITSDKKLFNSYKAVMNKVSILSKGPNNLELTEAFKNAAYSPGTEQVSLLDISDDSQDYIDKNILFVENTIVKLKKILKERKQVYEQFKENVHKDDISSILVFNRKVPNIEESLFNSELEKFTQYQKRLAATTKKQEELLKAMSDAWRQVLNHPKVKQQKSKVDSLSKKRNELINSLTNAYNDWNVFQENFTKAQTYYNETLNVTNLLLSKCKSFVEGRQQESIGLEESIRESQSRISQQQLNDSLNRLSVSSTPTYSLPENNYNFNSGSSLPPSLPPKPIQKDTGVNLNSTYLPGYQNSTSFNSPQLPSLSGLSSHPIYQNSLPGNSFQQTPQQQMNYSMNTYSQGQNGTQYNGPMQMSTQPNVHPSVQSNPQFNSQSNPQSNPQSNNVQTQDPWSGLSNWP